MKLFKHQEGKLNLGTLMVGVIALAGILSSSVYVNQPKVYAETATSPPQTCEATATMTEEQLAALTETDWDRLCGPITDVPPDPTNPGNEPVLTNDPCDSPATDGLSDAEYAKMCGIDTTNNPSDDEASDGAQDENGQATANTVSGSPVKLNLANKNTCSAILSQMTLGQIKSYGNSRIKARKAALATLKKKINNSSVGTKANKSLAARQKAANKRIVVAARKAHKSSASITRVKVTMPANHKKQTLKDIVAYNAILTTKNSSLRRSKTAPQAAQITCSAMFDSRVYSYLIPKAKAQDSIDKLAVKATAYEIYSVQAAQIRYIKQQQASASYATTDPATIKNQLNALQNNLNSITKQKVDSQIAAGGKSKDLFKTQLSPGYQSIKVALKRPN